MIKDDAMKYFVVFSVILLILYLAGFVNKQNNDFDFMSRDFTTAIKGFAILTVVWGHTGGRLSVEGIQFIAGVGVTLFLICSGYGLEMSYQKNGLKGFWKKRFLKVCIPFWIVELMGLLVTQTFNIKKYLLDAAFIKNATGYGWFMQYIVICYILFFIVKALSERTKINDVWMIIVVFAVWFIIDSCFFAEPSMPALRARQMLSFPVGMIVAKNKDSIEKMISGKKASLRIIGGGITGLTVMGLTQLSVIKALPYLASNAIALFSVLPLAVAVVCFMNTFYVLLNNSFLLKTGLLSYEIYLVHAYTLGIVDHSILSLLLFLVTTIILALTLRVANKYLHLN